MNIKLRDYCSLLIKYVIALIKHMIVFGLSYYLVKWIMH
jgi:hypothetical protein